MGEVAITVENVSKKYDILHKQRNEDDSLISAFAGGIKNLLGPSPRQTHEDFWALRDVNFQINRGERVGIIGRNGAGKSTLLKILSRIVKPTTGRMEYFGRLAGLLEVGTGFHGDLTGRENIYLNGSILGMRKKEIDLRFDEIVAFSEVEKFLDTPVKRYSSGMYVRLAFSVAAHLESDILIVDEVLAVGDSAFQDKCIGKINASQSEGKTVLFVSHNIGQVAALCNRGIFLESGTVKYDGTVDGAIGLYLNKNGGENTAAVIFEEKGVEYSINGITLLNSEKQITNQFRHDECYFFAAKLACHRRIEDAILSMLINDGRGKRVMSMSIPVSDKINQGQSMEFTAKLPPELLMPGEYTLSIAVHIPNLQLFDEHLNVMSFKIIDNGSEFYKYSGDLGYFFPKNEWLY